MNPSIAADFAGKSPKIIVLDDDGAARRMTAIRFVRRGYKVFECGSKAEFSDIWKPGLFDLIVADWQLAQNEDEHGDKVLEEVREHDWDVPFVLVSGRLDDDDRRAQVLEGLLNRGGASFITRGEGAIEQVCEQGEQLMERRDNTLLKVLLSLRDAAENGLSIQTSSGSISAAEQVAELVSKPNVSHDALRPISTFKSRAALKTKFGE